jgi:hypothetical protein
MLVVLVQWDLPRHLLGGRIDLDRAGQAPHGLEYLARDLRYGSVGGEGDPYLSPAAVLDQSLVRAQVKGCDECAGAVGRRQRKRLPAARAEPQGRVLELRLGWGELHRKLSERLRMRMERVAGGAPGSVAQRWPAVGHD